MKTLLPIALIITVLSSCKKESPEQNLDPAPVYSLPTSAGSYWVFERRTVDSLGNETPSGIDTLFLLGDTLLNGKSYLAYSSWTGNFPHPNYLRDSMGYLVDENGTIHYAYVHFGDTLNSWDSNGGFPGPNGFIQLYMDQYMSNGLTNLSTPAGPFDCYLRKTVSRDSAGGPVNVCGDLEFISTNYYASDIGMVRYENSFFSTMVLECKWFYYHLTDYYIAP